MGGVSQFQKWRGAAWLILSHAIALSLAAQPSATNAFLPPHATVVLLTGLSGDLQSEKTFQEQLQGWLDWLENLPVPPQQVFAFSDSPADLTPPAKLPAQIFSSTRDELLRLGKTLAGQTNPLVFIAWGHGGLQGKTPVFHVPGPRLTPADFKTFAAQMPGAESRWLLLFRGSGQFAAALVDSHRQIIASERDTMFNSDPVGLPLVLKSLRANPDVSFTALGEDLGRATAAWYQERNLIRTEEPTLWAESETPRLLSPAETESASAADKTVAESSPPTNSPPAVATLTNLTAGWQGIARVEARDYPGADGVVLRRRVNFTLSGGNPAITRENEEFIQILSADGKHLGDLDFTYSPPDEDITFLNCEVLQPDGKLLSLNPEEIRDAGGEPWGDYQAPRRKVFSLPGAAPGAILRVHYQSAWKTFPLPYVSLEVPVASELPMLDSSVQVSVPRDSAFHFAFDQITAGDPAIKQTSYGSTYSWKFENLPAHEREVLSPPFRAPSLLISTFPDWAAFSDWFARISRLADAITPEIAAKAAELTGHATTDRERAALLFDYVTSLRYVAVPLGVNSFRPHAADNVFKNQYGDCKDKANLYNTLLHSLKIDAQLVLVPRFTQANDDLPGFAFNHAISCVKLGDDFLWVDTTDGICRFGMLPPGDPGRKVLVIDGKSASLTQLPLPAPDAHQLKLRASVDCTGAGNELPATMEATAVGFPDYELRLMAGEMKGNKTGAPLLGINFRPAAGVFGLEKQSHTPASDLSGDFEWKAEGAYAGVLGGSEIKRSFAVMFWLPKEWDLALGRRESALFLNQGYPLWLDEEFEFSLPKKAREINFPANIGNSAEPLAWRIEWSKKSDTVVVAKLHLELARGELSRAETPVFQKQLRELFSALAAQANFTLSP